MFGMTGPDQRQGSNVNDLIHFGWTMKEGLDVLPEFLARFCDLLREMYWWEAAFHIEGPYSLDLSFRWEAADPANIDALARRRSLPALGHRETVDPQVLGPAAFSFDGMHSDGRSFAKIE